MTIKEALEILQIEAATDRNIVKTAYRKLLPKYNPEDDEQGFIRFKEAYNMLMDEALRKEFYEQQSMETEDDSDESEEFSKNILEEEPAIGFTPKTEESRMILTPKTKEEEQIEELVAKVNELYATAKIRNNTKKWKDILKDDIFLNIDYGQRAIHALLECIEGKYALKSEIVQLIFKELKLLETQFYLGDLYEEGYENYLMHKVRDISGYTDFTFAKVGLENEVEVCNKLFELLEALEKEQEEEKLQEKLESTLCYLLPPKKKIDVFKMTEDLIKLYPKDLYCKLLGLLVNNRLEQDETKKQETAVLIQKSLIQEFVTNYIEDDLFLSWYMDFSKSIDMDEKECAVTAFSKFGEYKKVLEYFLQNPSVLELAESETDRQLILSCLEIGLADEVKKRKEQISHWNKAKELLAKAYEEIPHHKGLLVLRMLVASELYENEIMAECYENALNIIPKNPYIYCYRYKIHCSNGEQNEGKELFKKVNKLKLKNYRLRLWELIFHRSYDFNECYNLQKPIEQGHELLNEMSYCKVSGELMADAYFVMGTLISYDGRYKTAPKYFDQAINWKKKPEYLFEKAIDNIKDGKSFYEYAFSLFKEIYDQKENWEDGESKNPRFSFVYERFRGGCMEANSTTNLHNLCALMGCCCEKIKDNLEAVKWYKKAILADPVWVDVASAFIRTLDLAFEEGEIDSSQIEDYLQGLDPSFEDFCATKCLRARMAYEKGDLETAKNIFTPISKIKLIDRKFSEGDWIIYADYYLGRIYHDNQKDMFAIKFIEKSLDGKRMDWVFKLTANNNMRQRIFYMAKELLCEIE